MPQPRKYETRSQQQAACRKRQTQAVQDLLAQKGLSAMAQVPTMPGTRRWSAMLRQAHSLLSAAAEEMQEYHDQRSAAWQEGNRAEELLAQLDMIQESIEALGEAGPCAPRRP